MTVADASSTIGSRTSKTHFFHSKGDSMMVDIERRVQRLTRVNISHAEDTQVLNYKKGGHYGVHYDFFLHEGNRRDVQKGDSTVQGGSKNRLATVFFYLNDVQGGGETWFPRAGGTNPSEAQTQTCDRGLGYTSTPDKNKALLFYNLLPNGQYDPYALHSGCAVEEGEKWSANVWIWTKENPVNKWKTQPIWKHPEQYKLAHEEPTAHEPAGLHEDASWEQDVLEPSDITGTPVFRFSGRSHSEFYPRAAYY